VAGAWLASQLVAGFLFEVQPRDPVVFIGVCVVLAVTGLVAALVPARRAAQVSPVIAMRTE